MLIVDNRCTGDITDFELDGPQQGDSGKGWAAGC